LFKNMVIDSVVFHKIHVDYKRDSNAVFINFTYSSGPLPGGIQDAWYFKEHLGTNDSIKIYYHGIPQTAKNPPWDGGFVWAHDSLGNLFTDVACEGTGASLWWPCKDHLSDKPDSMRMTFDIPNGLSCVSNGRLRSEKIMNSGYTRFTWFVSVPIINYDITLNIGDYSHISDYYLSGKDTLTLDYYVLSYDEERARKHFEQVKPMMACYENFFGKYPFYKDGYKLVETTYWGMEHQSCVAYGNHYKSNAFGFDFIIIHESAHEWWGNSLSCSDPADMWLHEAFATYAEALYIEYTQNYKTAIKYLYTQQTRIGNKYPIIGPYDVNFQGTENDDDEYFKGTWMLHTFRHVINNDSMFFAVFKGLQAKFKYSSTNTKEVIACINKITGKDYTPFFNEYLYKESPPIFYYKLKKQGNATILYYRWKGVSKDFIMPIKVTSSVKDSIKTYITVTPGNDWKTQQLDDLNPSDFSVDVDEFYVIPKKEE
ncbi:MAG TPA: M1 family metallopeptidase, partial [Bacteroidia bacterium]|nr:M1 family metallopeptidase [Bacteroidia bacterium]